jgi:uncharacterized protein (TIGR02996 family)
MAMTHDKAFLQAIIEEPEDDTPRLVYADWLDEHGKADRAEFIRVQCELAKLPGDSPRRRALEERERALLKAHRDAWLTEVAGWARPDAVFRRGFITEVSSTYLAYHEGARALFRRAPVRGVSLRSLHSFGMSPLHGLPYVDQLTSLRLSTPGRLDFPFDLPRLKVLVLETMFGLDPKTVNGWLTAPALPALVGLHLAHCWLRDADVLGLRHFPGLARLTALGLRNNDLSAVAVAALATSPHLAGLTSLDLGLNQRLGDAGALSLAGSPHLANLTTLSLGACGITDAGVEALAASPHLANLTDLDLSVNSVSEVGLQALVSSPHLKRLTRIGVLHTIYHATRSRSTQWLWLSRSPETGTVTTETSA